jgi:DNA-binding transcriptional ArsR family regulator
MEIKQAVTALGALAQETRLELFRLLVRQGPAGLPAGQLAQRLTIPPATLSFHLTQLAHAGLVKSRRAGRSVIYAADYAGMRVLLAFLTAHCCEPDDGLAPDASPTAQAPCSVDAPLIALDPRPTKRTPAERRHQKGTQDGQRAHRRQGR